MAEVLGRYHIISELGRGGMGVVYKALDPKLERFIAIKCLSDELSADEIVVARFLREARSVAALNHPNIAQIFVADEHEGKPYFVMEYVDGESLSDFIDREGQCSPEMARRVTEQAANALSAAAEEGIVHRDVKPGNIMIDRRGRAVLTDFGIACVSAEQSGSGSQPIMGTPGYLPPESLSGGPVDSRSDMFSLGAVWYEMLTGRRLMPGSDLTETYKQLAAESFPDLSELEGKVDDRVVAILRRLLAVQPDDRYPDWSALLADMAPLKTGRTGPVERSDSGPSTAEREVTEALASAQLSGQAATAVAGAPEATAVVETGSEGNHPVPVERKAKKKPGLALALIAVVLLVLAVAGLGLAYVAPGTWNKVTAWLPGNGDGPAEETMATASESSPAAAASGSEGAEVEDRGRGDIDERTAAASGAGASARASQALAEEDSGARAPVDANGQAGASGDAAAPADEAGESVAAGEGDGGTNSSVSDAGSADLEGVMPAEARESAASTGEAESPATPDADPAASEESSPARAEPETAITESAAPEPAPEPPPSGIVVIGVGDPVIADPMVREIESALRSSSHPLVQRDFVSGYRDHIRGEELDLAGLSEPALAAGARYVVVARALPAGERELQYYNRVETAYIAQLEAVTYDLHTMQQMGASPVEQIEFTSLNATRRAVDSVQPWLEGIRGQFD